MVTDMNKGLTERQKAYCRERAKGKSRAQAWEDAGYSTRYDRDMRNRNAYNMEHYGNQAELIQAEIERLRKQAEDGAILDRQQRQALLSEIALNNEEKSDNRLRAMDILNRMGGDYTDRVEQVVSGALAMSYEERKKLLEEGLKE